jgi:septum formation protein
MSSIILASASPRRQQLLQQAEVTFKVVVADIAETYPKELPPNEVAMHIATNKAKAVQQMVGHADVIIAADTIVVLENEIIGKPSSSKDAVHILAKLNGATHQVITGVCIIKNKNEHIFYDSTEVTFNKLSLEQIEHYVQHYKPMDKAGAYAIQEWIGVVGIKCINGCFYNVMGLPVSKVLTYL